MVCSGSLATGLVRSLLRLNIYGNSTREIENDNVRYLNIPKDCPWRE